MRSEVARASSRIDEGAIDIACTRLGFSERNLEEPIEGQALRPRCP